MIKGERASLTLRSTYEILEKVVAIMTICLIL